MIYPGVMTRTSSRATQSNDGSHPLGVAERVRFHNLLKLAAESPFEGERSAALAAAKRLAARHAMTLDEAASGGPPSEVPKKPATPRHGNREKKVRDVARHVHIMDNWVSNDKARRDAALAEAYERGLDNYGRKRNTVQAPRRNGSKRNPQNHATVLLQETSMPIDEIAALTGLDKYEVVGLKLKLRSSKKG